MSEHSEQWKASERAAALAPTDALIRMYADAKEELSASQAREAELREKLAELEANAQIEIDRLNAQILDRDKKLEERTEELLRIAGLNAANVGLLKAAEARIKEWQQGENEDLTAAMREIETLHAALNAKVEICGDKQLSALKQENEELTRKLVEHQAAFVRMGYVGKVDGKEELERLLSEARNVPEWKPIETAPKDGTSILAGRFEHDFIAYKVVHYNEFYSNPWRIHADEGAHEHAFTHWMPLPASPEYKERT